MSRAKRAPVKRRRVKPNGNGKHKPMPKHLRLPEAAVAAPPFEAPTPVEEAAAVPPSEASEPSPIEPSPAPCPITAAAHKVRFRPVPRQAGFAAHAGPYFEATDGSSARCGLWLEARHGDGQSRADRSVLAAFAQFLLQRTADTLAPAGAAAADLHLQFLGPAPLGQWLYGEAMLTRHDARTLFLSAELYTEAEPVALASAVFTLG